MIHRLFHSFSLTYSVSLVAFVGVCFCSLHSTRKVPHCFGWLSLHLFLSFVVGLPSVPSFRAPREKKQALSSALSPSLSLHARSFRLSFLRSSFPTLFPLFLWTVATLLIQGSLVYPRPRWPRSFPWGEHRIIVKRRLTSSSSPTEG